MQHMQGNFLLLSAFPIRGRHSRFSISNCSNLLYSPPSLQPQPCPLSPHSSTSFLAFPVSSFLATPSSAVIQYFRSCTMSSVSWYFFMSPFMLSLHLFFGRPLLFIPATPFAQMWMRSRLKQWPNGNHFSLMFSRKVSTGFTRASFLMYLFLMGSNLVFHLAHLKNPHFG